MTVELMDTVEDKNDIVARRARLGATVVDEVVDNEAIYRFCYICRAEGILIGLAQQLGQGTSREIPWNGSVENFGVATVSRTEHAIVHAVSRRARELR